MLAGIVGRSKSWCGWCSPGNRNDRGSACATMREAAYLLDNNNSSPSSCSSHSRLSLSPASRSMFWPCKVSLLKGNMKADMMRCTWWMIQPTCWSLAENSMPSSCKVSSRVAGCIHLDLEISFIQKLYRSHDLTQPTSKLNGSVGIPSCITSRASSTSIGTSKGFLPTLPWGLRPRHCPSCLVFDTRFSQAYCPVTNAWNPSRRASRWAKLDLWLPFPPTLYLPVYSSAHLTSTAGKLTSTEVSPPISTMTGPSITQWVFHWIITFY